MKLLGILIILIALYGMYTATDYVLNDKAVAAVSMGSAVAYNNAPVVVIPEVVPTPPSPNPRPPVPTDKHKRSDCPTNGWVIHGDSHKTRCPHCDPSWNDGKKYKLNLKDLGLSWQTANGKCCQDCTCKVCNCRYPGECLVKANGGKDVIIYEDTCDEATGVCTRTPIRKYSPNKPIYNYSKVVKEPEVIYAEIPSIPNYPMYHSKKVFKSWR